jgi:hypothetical protein
LQFCVYNIGRMVDIFHIGQFKLPATTRVNSLDTGFGISSFLTATIQSFDSNLSWEFTLLLSFYFESPDIWRYRSLSSSSGIFSPVSQHQPCPCVLLWW